MLIAYHFSLGVVDLATLAMLARNRSAAVWTRTLLACNVAAVCLAVLFADGRFGLMRTVALALFVHAPVLLAAVGILAWRRWRLPSVAALSAAVGIAGVGIDAFWIEPQWLDVSHVTIASPRIEQPLRIVVVADLQTDEIGEYERDVLRLVVEQKPDLVLLAGDYIQAAESQRSTLYRQLNEALTSWKPLGDGKAFAVGGNVDVRNWPEIFAGTPVQPVTTTQSFHVAGIQLTCLSIGDSFNPRLQVSRRESERFHVVLGHSPNYALGGIDADLLLAGHTHGGQVQLPGIGPLVTLSAVPRGWADGLTKLPDGGRLLVSRGIGMERGAAPRIRFLCRPELVVLDLVPQ